MVMGALVALTVFVASRVGPILTPDSLHYAGAAQALAAHGALRVPEAEWHASDSTEVLQQFPPGYPTTLAVLLRLGASRSLAIRLVDAAAACALMMLMLWLGDMATNAWSVRIAIPAFVIALRAIPSAWMSAWSEPLFLVAVLATLLLMVTAARRSWTYGLAAAAGNAVRYAGVSLLLAAVLWAAWAAWNCPDDPLHAAGAGDVGGNAATRLRMRLGRVMRAVVAASAPGIAFNGWWLLRARLHEVETPVATVAWMGNLPQARDEAVRTITEQLVPLVLPGRGVIACVALVVVGASLASAWRRAGARALAHAQPRVGLRTTAVNARQEYAIVVHATLLIAACYIAMLTYARLFVGGSIPLDDRLLAPIFLLLGLTTLIGAQQWLVRQSTSIRRAGQLGAGLWLLLAARQSMTGLRNVLADRDDYGSEYWMDTPVADWVRGQGRAYTLYSDDPVGTYFVSGRPSRGLPPTFDADSSAIFRALLQTTHGAILDYPQSLDDSPDAGLFARALGMCLVVSSEDGNVWTPATDPGRPCTTSLPQTTPVAPSPSTPTLPMPVRTFPPPAAPPPASSR
jgi:hypothetical protein